MTELKELVKFLDGYFDMTMEDASNNGLQVEACQNVRKIGFAVDACQEVFDKALEVGCDLVVTHHGISWKNNLKTIQGINAERVKHLLINNISLYAMHLPLDKHEFVGNNIQLCRLFGIKEVVKFSDVGYIGSFDYSKDRMDFIKEVKAKLETDVTALPFGPKEIKKICIVSGAPGRSYIRDLVLQDVDAFVVGEMHHGFYHEAKEAKINVISAGHYATEKLGIQALAQKVKDEFAEVDVGFIDVPTNL
jgi:dinuclear metal center YbgI/SA1388 family protein